MKTLAILAFTIATLFLASPTHAATLDDANRSFADGKYHESTLAYQALLAQNGYSAPILFDLGNSYYREGDLAQAILAYRRAQWLAPNDPDIAANLQAAQKQAGVALTESHWSDAITHILSASEWAWVGCAAWTLLCLSLLARVLLPQRRGLLTFVAVADAIVLFAAITGAALASDGLNQAVVIDKNAIVRLSPFPEAQTVFSPAPGETVVVQEAHDDFLRVKDATGHAGWIRKTQIAPVVPAKGA